MAYMYWTHNSQTNLHWFEAEVKLQSCTLYAESFDHHRLQTKGKVHVDQMIRITDVNNILDIHFNISYELKDKVMPQAHEVYIQITISPAQEIAKDTQLCVMCLFYQGEPKRKKLTD